MLYSVKQKPSNITDTHIKCIINNFLIIHKLGNNKPAIINLVFDNDMVKIYYPNEAVAVHASFFKIVNKQLFLTSKI